VLEAALIPMLQQSMRTGDETKETTVCHSRTMPGMDTSPITAIMLIVGIMALVRAFWTTTCEQQQGVQGWQIM